MTDDAPADAFDFYGRVLRRGRFLDRLEPLDPLEQAIEHGRCLIAEAGQGAVWPAPGVNGGGYR